MTDLLGVRSSEVKEFQKPITNPYISTYDPLYQVISKVSGVRDYSEMQNGQYTRTSLDSNNQVRIDLAQYVYGKS